MAEHKLLDEQWLLAVKAVIDCSDLKDRYQPRTVTHSAALEYRFWPRAPFRSRPRKQSLVGLILPVIDSFWEPRRSRVSGQKQSLQAFPQSAESGWLQDAAVAPVT